MKPLKIASPEADIINDIAEMWEKAIYNNVDKSRVQCHVKIKSAIDRNIREGARVYLYVEPLGGSYKKPTIDFVITKPYHDNAPDVYTLEVYPNISGLGDLTGKALTIPAEKANNLRSFQRVLDNIANTTFSHIYDTIGA